MNLLGIGIVASVGLGIAKVAGVSGIEDWSWWLVSAPVGVAALITAMVLFLIGTIAIATTAVSK